MELSSTAVMAALLLYFFNTFKTALGSLFRLILAYFVSSISVSSSQSEYSILSNYVYYLYQKHRLFRADNYRISLFSYSCDLWNLDGGEQVNPDRFQLDQGQYLLRSPRYGLMRVVLDITEGQAPNPPDWVSRTNFGQACTLTIQFVSHNQVQTFISDALDHYGKQRTNHFLRSYDSQSQSWINHTHSLGRGWNSLILPEAQKTRILNDAKQFFANKEFFEQTGIPYRRGLLLYGRPGTGKTTVVRCLQHELKIPLFVLNISLLDDGQLLAALSSLKVEKAIVLFEDIDVCTDVLHKREQDKSNRSKLTLSGFLNAIDGVQSPSGTYFVFTSNRPTQLDEAVLRTGRIDLREELHYLDSEMQRELITRLLPDLDSLDFDFTEDKRASDVQAFCLQQKLARPNKSDKFGLDPRSDGV